MSKKRKSFSFQAIDRHLWLTMARKVNKEDAQDYYFVIKFTRGGNRSNERVLGYMDHNVEKEWTKIKRNLPDLPPEMRQQWVENNISRKLPTASPAYKNTRRGVIQFYKSPLAKKLKAFLEEYEASPVSKHRKSQIRSTVKRLNAFSVGCREINPIIVTNVFNSINSTEKHKSPKTLSSIRKNIWVVAQGIGYRGNSKDLFRGVKFYNEKELKTLGIQFKTKGRTHLERDDVRKLICGALKLEDETIRSGIFIQLWTGCRPSDSYEVEVNEYSLTVKGKKTDTVVNLSLDKFLRAYLKTVKYTPGKIQNKKAAKGFKELVLNSLGESYSKIDRYCLRHTALTWLCYNDDANLKRIRDMAGHTTLRMLDENYANKSVLDQRPWAEAMPILIKGVPQGWHGFLLVTAMAERWPDLLFGKPPVDQDYKEVKALLVEKADYSSKTIDL